MYYIANKALPKPSKLVTDIGDGTDASTLVGEGSRDVAVELAFEQLLLRGGFTCRSSHSSGSAIMSTISAWN